MGLTFLGAFVQTPASRPTFCRAISRGFSWGPPPNFRRGSAPALRLGPALLGLLLSSLALPSPAQSAWALRVGTLLGDAPVFDGASDRRAQIAPLVDLRYGGAYMGRSQLGAAGALGISTDPRSPWVFMTELGVSAARFERRAHHLLGMGDRPENYWASAGVQRKFGPTSVKLGVAYGLKNDAGARGTLTFGHKIPLAAGLLEAQAAITGATAQNMNDDFGVSPEAAERRLRLLTAGDARLDARDLGSYSARGGLRDVSFSATFIRPFNLRTAWITGARATCLQPAASDSPLVRERTALSVFTGFTFSCF